jgi:hypothetical protein
MIFSRLGGTKDGTKHGTRVVQNFLRTTTEICYLRSMIYVDTRPAVRELTELTRKLSPAQFRQANARAINHTMQKARTSASKGIRARYNIPVNLTNKSMKLVRATSSRQAGFLKATSTFTPLSYFRPTQITATGVKVTTTRQGALASSVRRLKRVRKGGISVSIVKGQKKTMQGAFFMPGRANALVTARGKYTQPTKFTFRKKRINSSGNDTPIDVLNTVSVFKAAISPTAQEQIARDLMPDYSKRLIHEALRLLPPSNA